MVGLAALWLPILLAAVVVFLASSIFHMVLPLHRGDYHPLPNEDRVREVLRGGELPPGMYMLPYCAKPAERKAAATMEKYRQGPVGILTVLPSGPPAMGKYLGLWFAYCVVVGFVAAYLTGRTLPPGSEYLAVFRVAGTASLLAYGVAPLVDSIWKGQPWRVTLKHVADGLFYSLLTAGVFGWLWPR